jgi:phosphomannomutase
MSVVTNVDSLRSRLNYEPQVLGFGTSGRRGKVVDLTQLEIYLNALAELEYLQSLPLTEGGIRRGEDFYFAYDLRPSSSEFVAQEEGRGEIAQAIVKAIVDAGMQAVNLGRIPTPALANFALSRNKGSIMVTGSHIPFERNGYKTNSSRGELLKQQEAPINEQVRQVRQRLYEQPWEQSLFDQRGMLKCGHQDLPQEHGEGRAAYIERFTNFFSGSTLNGKRILVYQHSAVGRDLLVEILQRLGAQVAKGGRSDTFVPIDTENIDAAQLAVIQELADAAAASSGPPLLAVVSTDGDSDRPLVLGVDPLTGQVHFFGGDLVGMVVAEYLQADAVVVPISCNDAIDRGKLAPVVEPKTRIGSPFVIAGMEAALAKGKKRVCGWEPNGGFLTGSPIARNGAILQPLLTRDAGLPILGVLFAAERDGLSLVDLFARLPNRFSRAALLKQFPRATALKIVDRFSPPNGDAEAIHKDLAQFFTPAQGFADINHVDYTDGVRILFANGEVAHVRPSGNADELRIYAVADTQSRADAIAAMGVAEPAGILRSMEKAVDG